MKPILPWYQNLIRSQQQQKENHRPISLWTIGTKNSQWNTCKLSSITLLKPHMPWSSWFYYRDAKMIQYTQINKCNTAHKQSHVHLNRYRNLGRN
jgi:hypothetical protein